MSEIELNTSSEISTVSLINSGMLLVRLKLMVTALYLVLSTATIRCSSQVVRPYCHVQMA